MGVKDVLAQQRWAIGYCRAGEASGSYVIFWPLGTTGVWEVDFAPFHGFLGMTDEDSFFFSQDDGKGVQALDECDIEWPLSSHGARRAADKHFAWSRAAARDQAVDGPFLSPEAQDVERPAGHVDPWEE